MDGTAAGQTRRAPDWLAPAGFALGALWLLPVSGAWENAPDLSHAWAVPLLMAYLWWERWGERPAPSARAPLRAGGWLLAAALGLLALPLRLLLTPFPLSPSLIVGYTALAGAAALTAAWFAAGRAGLRWTAGPLLLTLSAIPAPAMIQTSFIIPLREGMAVLAAEFSNLLGHPALAVGTTIRLGNGWVGIDEACGGIRSLQACVMIGLFFGEWFRCGWVRRLALLGTAVAAALLGNFGRVIFLSLRAGAGPQALESVHDLAGWIAMAGSLVLTGWLACRWAGYRWPQQRSLPRVAGASSPAGAWLAVVAALFLVDEVATRLWFAQGEAARSVVPQWTIRLPVGQAGFHASPLSEPARELLRPDTYAAGTWQLTPDERVGAYYMEWRKGQAARSVPFLHNPTVCLPLSGCELIAPLDPIPVHWTGGEMAFLAYKFRRMNEDILVAFIIWDSSRGRPLVRPGEILSWRQWWAQQWTEVREARQHQPAQLFTLTLPWSHDAPAQAKHLIETALVPTSARSPNPVNH